MLGAGLKTFRHSKLFHLVIVCKEEIGYDIKLTCYCGRYMYGQTRNTVRIVYGQNVLEAGEIHPFLSCHL